MSQTTLPSSLNAPIQEAQDKGFEVLLEILKFMPSHPKNGAYVLRTSTNDEIVLQTASKHLQRHIIVDRQGNVELFHLDNADKSKSHSRIIHPENIDWGTLYDIVDFLFNV